MAFSINMQQARPHQIIAMHSPFFTGRQIGEHHNRVQAAQPAKQDRPKVLKVQAFKFMKQLGLKKPAFLPDFGLEKRKRTVDTFYTSFDAETLQSLLADDFKFVQNGSVQPFGKKEWVAQISSLKPSFPDFSWTHGSNYAKDDDGYVIVTLQATGHHTGQPWTLPGSDLPPVEASGKRFKLGELLVKLKIEDNQICELQYLAKEDSGPLALYKAIGGKVPETSKL